MDDEDSWWPDARPTRRDRVVATIWLTALAFLLLSTVFRWHPLGRYAKWSVAALVAVGYVAVLRPRFKKRPGRYQKALYTARTIRSFLNGTGDVWDWDDFTSCSLYDLELDTIRKQALSIDLPLGEAARTQLLALAEKAESIEDRSQAGPR